jgi:hypothetical protein
MFTLFREFIFLVCFGMVIGIVGFLIYGFVRGWEKISLATSRQSESHDY